MYGAILGSSFGGQNSLGLLWNSWKQVSKSLTGLAATGGEAFGGGCGGLGTGGIAFGAMALLVAAGTTSSSDTGSDKRAFSSGVKGLSHIEGGTPPNLVFGKFGATGG